MKENHQSKNFSLPQVGGQLSFSWRVRKQYSSFYFIFLSLYSLSVKVLSETSFHQHLFLSQDFSFWVWLLHSLKNVYPHRKFEWIIIWSVILICSFSWLSLKDVRCLYALQKCLFFFFFLNGQSSPRKITFCQWLRYPNSK